MNLEMKPELTLIQSVRDERDWHYGQIVAGAEKLPAKMSMREHCGPIRNQGKAGFCHSFAGTAMKNLQEVQDWGDRRYNFSPLGLARAVKARDGIVYSEGSTLKDVCKALCHDGVFDEVFYPYEKYKAGSLIFPPMEISEEEQENIPTYLCRNYARLDSLKDLKKALADRKPVLMGITCGEDIYDPVDGCVGLPLGSFIIGGHAILAIGYDDEKTATIKGRSYKGFIECQNSWGEKYGDGGFFWLPYEYVTYKTKDFGQSFLLDMFATVDLENDDLQGTTIEMRLGESTAYDDGKEILLDQPPMADEKTGRTLVPLRFVGEALGCRVEWLKASRQIIIRGEATDIQLTIGNQVAIVNGDKRLMDQAPVIDQRTSRTLVPLRFIAQALGNVVLWDGGRRKITILKKC